ncbi:inosine/xanthosine triphosphatase [Alteribacillus bidgolensis]|uniref:inosine/xanthosine triphosphatase n=2 Tax=Alteribacillus bidgolensis TaxID=930129 RepID=A0A1G8ERT3_9BACI|nr:inosine/xanthosine triphosphatase [Alteribacillus bidgolensis]
MEKVIAIGSKNNAKIQAAANVFPREEYIVKGYSVDTAVSDQPFSEEETKKGAVHRSKAALAMDAVIGIGLEGGVEPMEDGLYLCSWGALADEKGRLFTAAGAKILLPEEVAEGLYKGEELKTMMEAYTNKKGVSHNEGAVGIFSNGFISRADMFAHIVWLLYGQWKFSQKLNKS